MKILLFAVVFFVASGAYVSFCNASAADDPKVLLSQGKVNEALAAYDAIIAKDPDNYMNYYMRATTYLSMGKSLSALSDLDKAIKLRPEFDQAYLQRGKIYVRDGFYDNAVADFEACLKITPGNKDLEQLASNARRLKRIWVEAERDSVNPSRCPGIIQKLSDLIEQSPTFPKARLTRGQCYLRQNQLDSAILDYTRAANFMGDSSEQNYLLSKLYLIKGDREKAFTQVTECLRLAPESKVCMKLFKKLKVLNKHLTNIETQLASASGDKAQEIFTEYITEVSQANNEFSDASFPNLFGIYEESAWRGMCAAFVKSSNGTEAVKWCSKALEKDATSFELLAHMAEAHILTEDYEAAIRTYEKGLRLDASNRKFNEGLERAKMLYKRSKQKDYYKILGVPRNASDQEIKRAYRKLAIQWHPDKQADPSTRELAQKKMTEINQAYDILKDPKTRSQFDQGIDPNDPQSGFQGGHGGGQFFNQDQIFQIFQQFGGGGVHFGAGGGGGQRGGGGRQGGNQGGRQGGGYYGNGGHKFQFDL